MVFFNYFPRPITLRRNLILRKWPDGVSEKSGAIQLQSVPIGDIEIMFANTCRDDIVVSRIDFS